jgi:hypothetical protein
MPAFGFYRRVLFCGFFSGALFAVMLKLGGSVGLVGILAGSSSTTGFLALLVGIAALLSFWAFGPMLWRLTLLNLVLHRTLTSILAAFIFLGQMWLTALTFHVPLGLDFSGASKVFAQVSMVVWFASFLVVHLIPDKTGQKA